MYVPSRRGIQKRREGAAQENLLRNLSVKRQSQCHNMQEEESDCECPICGERFGDISHYGFNVMNANSGLMLDVEGTAPDIYICDLCDHR